MPLLALPDELLAKVFQFGALLTSKHDINAFSQTCHRLHRIGTPIVYSSFHMGSEWIDFHYKDPRPAILLQTLLRKPELRGFFKFLTLREKRIEYEEVVEWYGVRMDMFSVEDSDLVERAISALHIQHFRNYNFCLERKLCPFAKKESLPTDLPDSEKAAYYTESWLKDLMHGHWDAVYAVLLVLMRNLTTLRIDGWLADWFVDNVEQQDRPRDNHVHGLLSYALYSQEFAQNIRSSTPNNPPLFSDGEICEVLLEKLESVDIRFNDPEIAGGPLIEFITFVDLPSVKHARFSGVWDPIWFSAVPTHSLVLETLRIRQSFIDTTSLGTLIKCCEGLETFSYTQGKQPMGWDMETETSVPPVEVRLDCGMLMPYLKTIKDTLKRFSFGAEEGTEYECWEYYTEQPDMWEVWQGQFGSFKEFEKLESVNVSAEHLPLWDSDVPVTMDNLLRETRDLSHKLPLHSLRRLAIRVGESKQYVDELDGSQLPVHLVTDALIHMLRESKPAIERIEVLTYNKN